MSNVEQWRSQTARYRRVLVGAVASALIVAASAIYALLEPQSAAPVSSEKAAGSRALVFEPNRGQSDSAVQFIGRGPGYNVFLTATEIVVAPRLRDVVRMRLAGANPSPGVVPLGTLQGEVNYVRGDGSTPSLARIPTFSKVRYADVYPGIDVVYYGNQGRLEYDFIVRPDADPAAITLEFDRAQAVDIDDSGALRVAAAHGELRQPAPAVYQERDGERQPIDAAWVRLGPGRFGVRTEPYDRTLPLVIDPVVIYASYLGGQGDDSGNSIALDRQGNIFIAGVTTSPDFPGTPSRSTESAAFVAKLDANGQLVFSTYVLETDERGATGLAVDAAGNAYVTGRTSLWRETASNDVFVAKLDATGSVDGPAGYFFTFGGDAVDWGNRIAVDGAGNAYVVGATSGGTFPATDGAFQPVPAGEADAFVAKINPAGTALVYSTLLGGSGFDSGNGIVVDQAGHAYVSGSTESSDFPVTGNAFQRANRGCFASSGLIICSKAAFVTKLSPDGSALAYSTYLGGEGFDQASVAEGITIDTTGHAYVTGATTASNFPTTAGVLQPDAGERLCFYEVCTDAFVTKLDPTGARLVFSTYLFGEAQDAGIGIAVDPAGNVYVAGSTVSSYFPVVDAFQPRAGAYRNAFVAKLNADATSVLHATYLGAPARENSNEGASGGSAIALDAAGNVFVTGQTSANDFPTTAGAMQGTWGGCNDVIYGCSDGFVAKIAAAGTGVTLPVNVRMTSAKAVGGRPIEAAWSGIVAPNAYDRIGIYQLGRSDEQYEVYGGWQTTGTAAGTISLGLPAGLKPGWYELRLWSGDPSLFTPLARSAPFKVGDILELPSGGGGGGSSVPPGPGGGGASGVAFMALLVFALAGRRIPLRSPARANRAEPAR